VSFRTLEGEKAWWPHSWARTFMPARVALWTLYTIVQGLVGTGVWVLAHECGHQALVLGTKTMSRARLPVALWCLPWEIFQEK
jgi:fatty acid desaturase